MVAVGFSHRIKLKVGSVVTRFLPEAFPLPGQPPAGDQVNKHIASGNISQTVIS